jgi:hypothetical protein
MEYLQLVTRLGELKMQCLMNVLVIWLNRMTERHLPKLSKSLFVMNL